MTTYTYGGITLHIRNDKYHNIDCLAVREVQETYFWDEINPRDLRTVIDIGAHIGAFSVYVAHRNPNTQIVAIEPEGNNYDYLTQNVNLKPNVLPLHAFVGYDKSLNTIIVDPENSGGHCIVAGDSSIPAPRMITVEQIIDLYQWDQVDLLKIDCEGCEVDVLSNMPDETFKKINRIVGERHQTYDDFWDLIGKRLDQWYSIIDQPHPGVPDRGVFMAVRND